MTNEEILNKYKSTGVVLKAYSMKDSINNLVEVCYGNAKAAGWHGPIAPETEKYLKGTQLMLMVSEIAEAMEGERKGLKDTHLTERPMVEVELADAIIRIADYCGKWGYDLGGAVVEKLEYNKTRADHRPEERAKQNGKKF